jgi:N-methylhydantoinase A/oxoprolinase/acetone carboxylase beta subunit
VAKLERKGLAIYSGFTPTDAAHVLGMSSHWSSEAALKGALVWSRQMRQLHGYGRWSDGDPRGPAQKVFEAVVDAICHKLIEAGLNDAGHMNEQNASRVARLLAAMVLERGRRPEETPTPVFDLRFAGDLPLVAVGAPAASWYPGVSRALGVDLAVPTHGDVANAVGAVLGIVSQRVHLTVTQPQRGVFRVFTNAGPRDFAALPEAIAFAREVATQEATALAVEAGAGDIRVDIHIDDTSAQDDANNSVFFEARVSADATGKPREAVR